MRSIDAGISGTTMLSATTTWKELVPSPLWQAVLSLLTSDSPARPVQALALQKHRILECKENVIVSAPTNSGKSLVGIIALLNVVREGHRGILLEPLRAIAREKADELEALAKPLSAILGCSLKIRVSTGDYRLEGESFASPPPQQGEIIIATPERLEALLRNPKYDQWLASIRAVCVDEAHLINTPDRGATLEYLITSLRCLQEPPRLVLLSATLGDLERARDWLSPCDVVAIKERYPPLHKEVLELDPREDANEIIAELAREILSHPFSNLLVFVYQTASAERLAAFLQNELGEQAGSKGVLAYHAQMSMANRKVVRTAFHSSQSRCVVTTTALALGVNLPATHVIIRDTTFAGIGPLPIADLLQMMGRAGRGEYAGKAIALVRPNDAWSANRLAIELRMEVLPSLVSHFKYGSASENRSVDREEDHISTIATQVAAQLARDIKEGRTREELEEFFTRSLGGKALAAYVTNALGWLSDPTHVLAYRDKEDHYRLTVLGLMATQSILPLSLAAGFAQLLRDLLSLDPSDQLLTNWRPLDHYIILNLLSDRPGRHLRPFSAALVEQVDAWMERMPDRVPLLYRQWIAGQRGASRASEVLGSLGIRSLGKGRDSEEWARKEAYLATFRSIILDELGKGVSITDIERQWGIKGLAGIEERWRDEYLWLLSGLGKVLDLRCIYFHLRERCNADPDRIRRVKRLLHEMRYQTFELRERLKYCSPLGPMLQSIRRTQASGNSAIIGIQSIRHLENAGIRNLQDLIPLQTEDLMQLGIRRDFAKQIRTYLRRRLQ